MGDGDNFGMRIVDGGPCLCGRTSPKAQWVIELPTPRGVGALKGNLPQVALSSGEKGLSGPAKRRHTVGQGLGKEGVICDIGATTIGNVTESGDFKKETGAVDIVQIIIGKIR